MICCFFSCTCLWAQPHEKPYVVMVSLDGFRWDYPQLYHTPNLNAMAGEGVSAKKLLPSFPTKTFPNHYSIITGLYPDHHGITANKFYDPATQKLFSLSGKEKLDPYFYGGQPLWNTAEQHGIKTASFYWAGSDVAINGSQPSIWKHYDESVSFSQRIDSVVQWLQLPEDTRPHFITLYIEQPDKTSHAHGPASIEVEKMVTVTDSLIGVLRGKIMQLDIGKKVNLVVLSDHGMTSVNTDRAVSLAEYIPKKWLALPAMGSPVVVLKAAPGYYDSILSVLPVIPHVKAYPSSKVPARLHFGNNPRALDFTLIADIGWSIITDPPEKIRKGNHGFDNKENDMHAIFYAAGPAFKQAYVHKPFENIHVYALLAHILNIPAEPTDGSFKKVKRLLK
ncbi:MAG: alkaline phosphatase family protein [Chitinophagaceae bacterium]|nr:alkaline phosphatase family protein [Chitinophagaceae bacterium]